MRRPLLLIALVLFLLTNASYWQDPWFWRNYVRFLASGSPTEIERLVPEEKIRGDGSYVLPVANEAERVLPAATLQAMRDYAAEFGSHALVTVHRGVIQDAWYASHWQPEWPAQSQSMHKSLLGLFIGMAIADGKIASVDEPVSNWITEWADDPRGAITLRNMLHMSSGLGQYQFTINPFSDGIRWLNSGRSIEPILRTPLADWEQGSRWDYNNINSEILGIVLERAYDMRYSELLEQKLWQPMGGDYALVHTDSPGGRAFTSCCLGAPVMDWVRMGMLLLNKGEVNGKRLVSREWIDAMIRPSPVAGHYGYQVWLGYNDPPFPEDMSVGSSGAIASEAFAARDTWMTWGRGQQHIYVVPSYELVIVRMGPALGRAPIKPGYDVPRLVNLAVNGMQAMDATAP